MQERTSLVDALEGIGKVERELDDNVEMIALGEAENDESVVVEAENALKALKKEVARRELEALLAGEADRFDSYLEVHAGGDHAGRRQHHATRNRRALLAPPHEIAWKEADGRLRFGASAVTSPATILSRDHHAR